MNTRLDLLENNGIARWRNGDATHFYSRMGNWHTTVRFWAEAELESEIPALALLWRKP